MAPATAKAATDSKDSTKELRFFQRIDCVEPTLAREGVQRHQQNVQTAVEVGAINLENAVERARGCCHGGQWPGARRPQAAPPRNDEQRRQCPPGLCHRVRSGITHKVSVIVLTKMRKHQGFQRVQSGQLRFLG
jgi:hypothetical protein